MTDQDHKILFKSMVLNFSIVTKSFEILIKVEESGPRKCTDNCTFKFVHSIRALLNLKSLVHDALVKNTWSKSQSELGSIWLESFDIQTVTVFPSQIPVFRTAKVNLLFLNLWSDS